MKNSKELKSKKEMEDKKEIVEILKELSKPVMEVKLIGEKTEITRRDFNDSDINDYGIARLKYLKDHDKVLYQNYL